MRIGSLYAGIGGFDLAARWMGWSTAWYSEIDPACCHWMAEHFPDAKSLGDVRLIDWTTVEPVDLVCGGFPCQPHSQAGKRKGSADERDLWPEFERAIRSLRPRYVLAENVPGLFTSDDGHFFGTVLGALAALGYDAEWTCLSAADVGAPHERERVWIVAYPDRRTLGGLHDRRKNRDRAGLVAGAGEEVDDADGRGWRARAEQSAQRIDGGRQGLDHSDDGRQRGHDRRHNTQGRRSLLTEGRAAMGDAQGAGPQGRRLASREGAPRSPWADAVPVRGADRITRLVPADVARHGLESPLCPVAPRLPGRVARLRATGNTVVPEAVYEVFQAIDRFDGLVRAGVA